MLLLAGGFQWSYLTSQEWSQWRSTLTSAFLLLSLNKPYPILRIHAIIILHIPAQKLSHQQILQNLFIKQVKGRSRYHTLRTIGLKRRRNEAGR